MSEQWSGGPAPAAAGASDVGAVVNGKFRIDRELTRGPHGPIWAATHLQTGESVALEVFRLDPAQLNQFLQEAQQAVDVVHENVVKVRDFGPLTDGTAPGGVFLTRDLFQPDSLRSLLAREAPLPPAKACELATQMAQALAAAHRSGVLHREIKPESFVVSTGLDEKNQVKIMDLASPRSSEVRTSQDADEQTRTISGIADYFSPEQGRNQPVDARTDVYTLGVVLFEMLTGRPPFSGPNFVRVLAQHVAEPPPAMGGAVPAALEQVVRRALEKPPDRRFQNMPEFAAALQQAARSTGAGSVAPAGAAGWVAPQPAASPEQTRWDSASPSMHGWGPAPATPHGGALPEDPKPPKTLFIHRDQLEQAAAAPGPAQPSVPAAPQGPSFSQPPNDSGQPPAQAGGGAAPWSDPKEQTMFHGQSSVMPAGGAEGDTAFFERSEDFAALFEQSKGSSSIRRLALIGGGVAAAIVAALVAAFTLISAPEDESTEDLPVIAKKKATHKPAAAAPILKPQPQQPPPPGPAQPQAPTTQPTAEPSPPVPSPPPSAQKQLPTSQSKPRRRRRSRRSGNDKRRSKLSPSDLAKGIGAVERAVNACGKSNMVLPGMKVKVRFTVEGKTGRVSSAKALKPHRSSPLGQCVAKALRSKGVFPKAQEDTSHTTEFSF